MESAPSSGPVKTALVVAFFADHQLFPKRPSVPPSKLVLAAPAELMTMRTMRTVSHGMKTQLDKRRAAAVYECAIPFEFATTPAFRESTGSLINGWAAS